MSTSTSSDNQAQLPSASFLNKSLSFDLFLFTSPSNCFLRCENNRNMKQNHLSPSFPNKSLFLLLMLLSQITNQNPRTDKLLFLINHWQFFVNHKCHSFPRKHWESDIFLEFLQIFPPQSGAVFRFNFLRSVRASLLSNAFTTTYPTRFPCCVFLIFIHF